MTADAQVCDWGSSCGLPATRLLLEGAPADVFHLYSEGDSWRPMCDGHVRLAALCLVAADGDYATVTRRIDP